MSLWAETVGSAVVAFSKDRLAQLLLSESHLTERQLLALLIDVSVAQMAQNPVKYEEKARSMPRALTRGAYNRTLAQARRNVIRSFFTLYLLGYMGLLNLDELSEHMKLGEELKSYVDSYLEARSRGSDQERVMMSIHKQLLERVTRLAAESSMKPAPRL